jgi:hypothetical protein
LWKEIYLFKASPKENKGGVSVSNLISPVISGVKGSYRAQRGYSQTTEVPTLGGVFLFRASLLFLESLSGPRTLAFWG